MVTGMDFTDQVDSLGIDQIERLVLSLYEPSEPRAIAATQAALTQLHSSPRAWSIARDLLSRTDEKVKFHGALIIIIKLNTESSSLSDEDATELLLNLVGWYIDSLTRGSSPLVTRKLASALATFLIQCHRLWPRYIIHLATCLTTGQPRYPESLSDSDSPQRALEGLDAASLRAILWVVENVMEDASKVDVNTEKNIGLYGSIRHSTEDAVSLLSRSMSTQAATLQTYEDAIKCLQSWIWFSQRASSRDKYFMDCLRPLLSIVIESTPVTPTDSNMEILTDVLQNFPGLFIEDNYDMLANILSSQWAEDRHMRLLQGDFEFDSLLFGQLLLAFSEARVETLMRSSDNRSRGLLLRVCALLTAEGYPAVEDKIFVPALEFWSTYVETLTDEMYSTEEDSQPWVNAAVSFVMQAVSNAWQKISFPLPEEFAQWDTNDRTAFSDARKELADLLQSTYTLTGPQIVFTFADLLVSALRQLHWSKLEAAAFSLGSLADCTRDDTRCDDALSSVFSSSLFPSLQDGASDMPHRTRQSCILLVEQYTDYFERNTALLPAALNLLFGLVNEPGLTTSVSKSIHRLCSSCRRHLSLEVWAFLDEYQKLADKQKLDCFSTERILGGISCVAQGSPDEYQKLTALGRILDFIERDLTVSLDLVGSSQPGGFSCSPGSRCLDDSDVESPALHMSVRVLRCLVAVGRGFQSPSDGPIDIEGASGQGLQPSSELSELQRRIFGIMLRVESSFPTNSEVVELMCSILRTGFSESEAGPFVFPPKDIGQYLIGHGINTPRIGVLVSTACSLVSSFDKHVGLPDREEILTGILLWVIELIRHLPGPDADTELTHNAIDFSSRLVAKNPSTLLQLQPFEAAEYLFLFTLRVLDDKEPLPKAAAADFWVTFMSLDNEIPGQQDANGPIMDALGPLLGQSLARNIGGNASRSELDKLSEPIKKLVSRYPSAKVWLGSGLEHASFPSSKVTPENKSLFIKKLVSLRGSRATNQVVRDFWLAARGSNFAYTS